MRIYCTFNILFDFRTQPGLICLSQTPFAQRSGSIMVSICFLLMLPASSSNGTGLILYPLAG